MRCRSVERALSYGRDSRGLRSLSVCRALAHRAECSICFAHLACQGFRFLICAQCLRAVRKLMTKRLLISVPMPPDWDRDTNRVPDCAAVRTRLAPFLTGGQLSRSYRPAGWQGGKRA